MLVSGTEVLYDRQDPYRIVAYESYNTHNTMTSIFHSAMNIEQRPTLLLGLLAWQLATTLAYDRVEHYPTGRYASPKDSAATNTLADYQHGYGAEMNDFGQHQLVSMEYQTQYDSAQARYGSSSTSGGGGVEHGQQSHISAGYQHHQPEASYPQSAASGNAYEAPHQSNIDKFVENNFSIQYEDHQERAGDVSAAAGGYDDVGRSSISDYHQNHAGFTTAHQHTDVINYVPYPVVKKLHVPYSAPVQIPISHAVIIPVRKPVPIHIPIMKQVQVPVEKELKIPIERLVPYPVEKQVPVPVEKHVPYPVVRYVPIKVHKPYPVKVPVVKTIVHKVKQMW